MDTHQSFVGLEMHVQLLTRTKVFCSCRATFGDEPNTNICPICTGQPGVLPALNENAISMGYVVARALECTPSARCRFDRKNYFYPDLPKNYQISQFAQPLGRDGHIEIDVRGQTKRVRIKEIHLEEDAGKMVHAGDMSLLDYNRAGTPLLEIVTEPDLEVGEEAEALLQELRRIVRYLGVCDGNMEEGSLRCDANVSVNAVGLGLGSKVEVKNLNSSRFVRKAIEYEIERQRNILVAGGVVAQETRLWNENRDLTETMRTKESANDYRYFPEPDLPEFVTDERFMRTVEQALVELPRARRARLRQAYGLTGSQAAALCDERETADYFEAVTAEGAPAGITATWMLGDLRKQLHRHGHTLSTGPITATRLAQLLKLLEAGTIHGKIAKQVLAAVAAEDTDPTAIIEARGWRQITDPVAIGRVVDQVLAAHPHAVDRIRSGDSKPLGFLVGQVMQATEGRAEPATVRLALDAAFATTSVRLVIFGGAITGARDAAGRIGAARRHDVQRVLDHAQHRVSVASLHLGDFLSEEILPEDWARLITAIGAELTSAAVDAIVVSHGTDTLAFTAALLYWIFGDSAIPIVLTAAAGPIEPDVAGGGSSGQQLAQAVTAAKGLGRGVHVYYAGQALHPVNLRLEHAPRDVERPYRTMNAAHVNRHPPRPFAAGAAALEPEQLRSALEHAVARTHIVRVFPGLLGSTLAAIMEAGARFLILELYDSGTANLRRSPFGLRDALVSAAQRGVQVVCTSQQEGVVDMDEYATSHELWKLGATPMQALNTESSYTLLLAAQLSVFADRSDLNGTVPQPDEAFTRQVMDTIGSAV